MKLVTGEIEQMHKTPDEVFIKYLAIAIGIEGAILFVIAILEILKGAGVILA